MTPPKHDYEQTQPFSFAGVKIPVAGSDNVSLVAGDPIRVIYQLWEQPGSPVSLKGKNLEVSYLIGKLGVPDKKEQTQKIDRAGFDPQGNLLMGTDLPTTDLHPGNYRLVIHVTDPESNDHVASNQFPAVRRQSSSVVEPDEPFLYQIRGLSRESCTGAVCAP